MLKYEITDVFCVKKYTFKPKMLSASGDFVPHTSYPVRPQTPYLGFATGPYGDFSFVESKKSLNYTLT